MQLRADRVRQARESKGLTQRELAELAGITLYQISRYETGKSDISGDSLATLAHYLDVSADYLLGLSHEPRGKLGESPLTEEEHQVVETLRREGWEGVIHLGAERLAK